MVYMEWSRERERDKRERERKKREREEGRETDSKWKIYAASIGDGVTTKAPFPCFPVMNISDKFAQRLLDVLNHFNIWLVWYVRQIWTRYSTSDKSFDNSEQKCESNGTEEIGLVTPL